MSSGVFKGGHSAMPPPLWPDHENFLQATLYKKVRFWPKIGEFVVFIEHSEAKSVSTSTSGGLRPLTPRPGALPLDPAGGSAQTPVIDSLSTRSPASSFAKF